MNGGRRKREIYLPGNKPVKIQIPEFKFFTIEGEGNPNDELFPEYIGVLYSLAYAVKMSPKKGTEPEGYFDYSVYPLEGVWDISEEAKKSFSHTIDKNDLVFTLMIRQPDFVDEEYALNVVKRVKISKPHELLSKVRFESITEGECVQMLHIGSYDDEPESFRIMEEFAGKENLKRTSKVHREIYLSDARRVEPEKLKTVLRFKVESK